jgi:hypothetical protein
LDHIFPFVAFIPKDSIDTTLQQLISQYLPAMDIDSLFKKPELPAGKGGIKRKAGNGLPSESPEGAWTAHLATGQHFGP